MLDEHTKTGSIKNPVYSSSIQVAFQWDYSSIVDSVTKEATSMTKNWIPEIVQEVEKVRNST